MTGLRSSYVMSSLLAPMMVEQKSGLMVQISSFGGVQYLFDVGYGVGNCVGYGAGNGVGYGV